MIVFVGCSYTWGSGLQYEYLQDKGWSIDEINKVLPVNYHLENLSYEADEYRKQNNWPNLVSKKLDKAFAIGTYTNGGSQLSTIRPAIEYTHRIARTNSIDTIVIQFTDWLRDVNDEKITHYPGDTTDIVTQEFIDNSILNQIQQIVTICDSLREKKKQKKKKKKKKKKKNLFWFGFFFKKKRVV